MEHSSPRHPRNLMHNARVSASTKYNTTQDTTTSSPTTSNNIKTSTNQNKNTAYTGVYYTDQNTVNPIDYNTYSNVQRSDTNSDHNIYRTRGNLIMHSSSAAYNTEQNISQNEENTERYSLNNEEENLEFSTGHVDDDDTGHVDDDDTHYDDDCEDESVYSDTIDGTTGNNFTYSDANVGTTGNNFTHSNTNVGTTGHNSTYSNANVGTTGNNFTYSDTNIGTTGNNFTYADTNVGTTGNNFTYSDTKVGPTGTNFKYSDTNIGTTGNNFTYNQNTFAWNQTSNTSRNLQDNSVTQQGATSLWNPASDSIQNTKGSDSIQNTKGSDSIQNTKGQLYVASRDNSHNQNHHNFYNENESNFLHKNEEENDNLHENDYDNYDNNYERRSQFNMYNAKNNIASGSNQVANQNINSDFKNQSNSNNGEYGTNNRGNSYGGNEHYERDNNVVNNTNGDIQKRRGDMIIVLSLLQDMCTAVEYTESVMATNISKTINTPQNSNENIALQGDVATETEKDVYNEEYEDEKGEAGCNNSVETILDTTVESTLDTTTENIASENEASFEELSDDDSDKELRKEQLLAMKNKSKAKPRNQRKNIRNVFSDGQLDAATKLLREKEQERLQRLGLMQSIENTGKILRASVKTIERKPAPVTKKKSTEVICLDSDSDGADDDASRSSCTSKSKQRGKEDAVLVLSSDSEGEEESGPDYDEKVQSEDYYSELGLHTNDALNVCDDGGRILVNVQHNKDDKDIFLHSDIAGKLKAHQIGGIRFLYDNLIESVAHFRPDEGNGCILAHAMGLGKTIQTITFIDLFLRCTSAKKVLCVVPVNTIQNWMNEFNRWLPAKKDHFSIRGYVPKVAVPKISTTPKSKKAKRTKKQEEDHAIIQDLLDDMVDFVCEKQVTNDVSGVLNKLLDTVCKDGDNLRDAERKPVIDPVKSETSGSTEPDGYRHFRVFLIDAHKNQMERAKVIEQWDKGGGVLLVGYEMYRSIALYKVQMKAKGKVKKGKKLTDENGDVLLRLKKAMCKPGPDLVVCDEGHRIRNYQSGISQALKSIKTRKRLVLTGYPLQNNLIEYWCMVDFVRPNYLGSRQEFSNMFERPIMNGQCVDSTPKDKHLMKQRAHVLYSLLQGFVQRRGHDVFNKILPSKEEHVLMIRLAPVQKALYNRLIELTRDAYNDSLNPVKTFSLCCKIWNHPDILFEAIQLSQEGKNLDIISDQDDIALDDGSGRHKRKRKQPASFSPTPNQWRQNIGFDPFGTDARDLLTDITQWASPIFKSYPYKPGSILNSGKFFILKNLLDQSIACTDKMLVFSQSLLTLNAIETMLQKSYSNVDGSCWKKARDYYRLDGSTSSLERERLINSFNDEGNKHTHLFLLSTRAGCLGINLVAANRVVVFDVSWNPCHDAQAVCRIYRYGQTKQCHIYRLVSSNTMEKKIYYRQISKQGISDRVVDEVNLTENFSKNEIASLVIEDWIDEPFLNFSESAYSFPDPVMANTLLNCNQWITKLPFEHESLLINENNTKLSGSEKRAAKREYEQERMMAQATHLPYRSYPLQQNFPRDTPVAPVKPFLWRPPPLNQSNSWMHPSSLFHHTVSHNVTVPSTYASSDPLQILRQDTHTGDHSYTGGEVSTSTDREGTPDYFGLGSQFSSIRSAFASTNFTTAFNRSRNLLNIGSHNDPLSRLSGTASGTASGTSTGVSTAALSSSHDINSSISAGSNSASQDTTGAETISPTSSIIQDLLNYRNRDREDKSREASSDARDTRDVRDMPLYHREQSLNFAESGEFYDSSSNDAFTNRGGEGRWGNVEVIVLDDDDEDD